MIKTAWTANEKSSQSTTLRNLGIEKIEAQETTEILKELTIPFLNNTFTKHNSYWNTAFKNMAYQE